MLVPPDLGATDHTPLDSIPWAVLERPWGVTRMQLVAVSLATNTFVTIIDYVAGTQLQKHHHTGPVHAYTMTGRWRYLEYDWVAEANSYVYEPPGTNHTLRVLEDMRALFVTQGAFIHVDDGGAMIGYSDAQTTLRDVEAALARQGLRLPASVVKN